MKVEFVELSGFRGVRDQLRVDFSDGFVVLGWSQRRWQEHRYRRD